MNRRVNIMVNIMVENIIVILEKLRQPMKKLIMGFSNHHP